MTKSYFNGVLQQEYLKDMGIVKLGDIIAILKHAKSEDGKRTTEKVYKSVSNLATEPKTQSEAQVKANDKINRRPEAKTEPKATVRTVSVKTDHLLPSSSTTTSKLTSRLGPPAPKSFLDLGIGAEKSAKEDIFKRLDKASTSVRLLLEKFSIFKMFLSFPAPEIPRAVCVWSSR